MRAPLFFQRPEKVRIGSKRDSNRHFFAPIGRDLQDCGAGKAAMGEQDRFVEAGTSARDARIGGDSGKRLHPGERLLAECQRHKSGARLGHRQPELRRKLIAICGRAHFRDRLAAAGDDEIPACHDFAAACQSQREPCLGLRNFSQPGFKPQFDAGLFHFGKQHADDVFRGIVAKQLTQGLFVPADAISLDQGEKIVLRIALEGGFGEMRIGGEKIARTGMEIGEIAPSSPRDANFLARRFQMLQNEDAASARTGVSRAHHPGRPGAEDHRVVALTPFNHV